MMLVSFSSAEDALSNDVKYMTLLARKILKIRLSALVGHPVYLILWKRGREGTGEGSETSN